MGLTVLDAGVVIAALDADDVHHTAAVAALRACLARGDVLAVPTSVYAECLVGPYRRGGDAVSRLDAFHADLNVHVESISSAIAHGAARLRAERGNRLRLADALVVATAAQLEARQVLTTDARWPSGLDIEVVVVGGDVT